MPLILAPTHMKHVRRASGVAVKWHLGCCMSECLASRSCPTSNPSQLLLRHILGGSRWQLCTWVPDPHGGNPDVVPDSLIQVWVSPKPVSVWETFFPTKVIWIFITLFIQNCQLANWPAEPALWHSRLSHGLLASYLHGSLNPSCCSISDPAPN